MKFRLFSLLVLFLGLLSQAQVSLLADTDKKILNGKERFTLYVIQELDGNELIQETPLRTPDLSKFHVLGQGSVRQTYGDPATSTVINQLIYEFLLEPKSVGKFKIGSFLVTVNGQIYMTEPFDITVKEGDAGHTKASAASQIRIEMEVERKHVFPNQPTLAVIRAYSKDFNQLRRVGKVKYPKSEAFTFKSVAFDEAQIEQKGGVSSKVIGKALITVKTPGTVSVPGVRVGVLEDGHRSEELHSGGAQLTIKPLPTTPPSDYRGAVGRYTLSLKPLLGPEPLEVGKAIAFDLELRGSGNLNRGMLPKLVHAPSHSIFRPELAARILGGENGLEGEVTARYLVIPRSPGRFSITTTPFVYFDPKDGTYHRLQPSPVALNVLTAEEISGNRSAIEKVNEYTNSVLETVNTPIVETAQYKIEDKDQLNWKTLLSNYTLIALFLAVLLLFYSLFRRFNRQGPSTHKRDLGSVQETEQQIRMALSADSQGRYNDLNFDAHNANRSSFFQGLEDLDAYATQKLSPNDPKGLKSQIEARFGAMAAEEYRNFREKVKMEKYAPAHAAEPLEGLFEQAKRIYSKIV